MKLTDHPRQEKYYKSYENSTEEKFRKEIFSKNWDLILKCNEDYKRNYQNFSCTVNEFADLTDEEFEQSFANLPKELLSFPSVGYRKNKRYKRQDIPVSVDWRNTAVTPVKYQVKFFIFIDPFIKVLFVRDYVVVVGLLQALLLLRPNFS